MQKQHLPYSSQLPVELLASVFSNVTNSYKFYWFLAILEYVKKGRQKTDISDLIIEMIGEVWYPINYFRLSFGKWDRFDQATQNIQQILGCSEEIRKHGYQNEDSNMKNFSQFQRSGFFKTNPSDFSTSSGN